MENNTYKIVKENASDEGLIRYKECFEKNGTDRDVENLKWLHQKNVVKTSLIFYALTGNDDVAAIYTALPVMAVINNNPVKALQSIDTLTDKGHRGKGLFIKLANELYNNAASEGFAFVYGFPNENSAPGFFKKLGWISFGEVPFLIKPLKISYFFKKFFKIKSQPVRISGDLPKVVNKNGLSIRPIDEFNDDYQRLWETVAGDIKVTINRNADYMNWRFINKPGEFYYKYGIYENNQLAGILIFTIKNKHDGLVAYIMEFVYSPGKINIARKLLRFANKFLRSQKVDIILTWCLPGSFNYKTYKSCGYFKLWESIRPQKLFLGVKIFNTEFSDVISYINNWYISYSDSDTV